ncbi:MIP/aquaporin family protein [Streptomyces sp. NPDC058394]|uniref:MIP/aquaporin family protein n=1 Tax=unclassified Streptomyces TaxID=2593676 RepID=UPI00364BD826
MSARAGLRNTGLPRATPSRSHGSHSYPSSCEMPLCTSTCRPGHLRPHRNRRHGVPAHAVAVRPVSQSQLPEVVPAMTRTPASPSEPRPPNEPGNASPGPAAIAGHSTLECFLAFVLLFGVATIVRWVVGPSPISDAVTQIHLQLLIIGGAVGLLLAALILSWPGRISGGHINPAISLAMWRFGVFPGVSVVPYIAAQLIGSVLGVLAARAVWGSTVSRLPVVDAALQPGPGWTAGALFAVEAAGMGVIVYLVGYFLQTPRLAPKVPWLVGFLIGAAIALLGTTTGGSVNPARQFGPAVVSGALDFLWVYLLAPMVGAALAAAVLDRVHTRRTVLTHRLCGTQADGAPLPRGQHDV